MTEHEMIDTLEWLIARSRDEGHETGSIQQLFDVGEWLIAFEGVMALAEADPPLRAELAGEIDRLDRYFRAG